MGQNETAHYPAVIDSGTYYCNQSPRKALTYASRAIQSGKENHEPTQELRFRDSAGVACHLFQNHKLALNIQQVLCRRCTFDGPEDIRGKRRNKLMMKPISLVLATLLLACTLHAQKFGHVNTAAILDAMPEVKTADQLLSAFQEGLIKGGESKAAAFEADYRKYLEDVNAGTLSKVQQTDRENTLAKTQQEIQQYEQQVQLQVLQKREELLKPILQKVDEAIKAEGKEGGYTFIFDSSVSGALLFAQESDDLLAAVKKRLGIQ